jgi:general secretion pathway protein K
LLGAARRSGQSPRVRQHGAALITAMLTVTLVATFATAALWQQWRSVEVEAAERTRVQSAWVLTGALDWARLILREDARAGGADYLSEPWAVALQEARLSTFLAADRNNTADTDSTEGSAMQAAFLSGQITDLQSRMNLLNLVDNGKVSEVELLAFGKLFDFLGLPPQQLATLADNLRLASIDPRTDASIGPFAPLMPQKLEQLAWLGLPRATVVALGPFVTLLPVRTPVNLNTAPAEVIYAMIPALEMADAQRLVQGRSQSHLRTLTDANDIVMALSGQLSDTRHSVVSRFFEVRGRLRLDQVVVEERSVLQRDGLDVKTLWRERGAVDLRGVAPPPSR